MTQTQLDKVLYTAKDHTTGGRDGDRGTFGSLPNTLARDIFRELRCFCSEADWSCRQRAIGGCGLSL